MNTLVIYIIIVQIALCAIVAIIGSFWYRAEDTRMLYIYFQFDVEENGVISFFSFFLLLSTLLPISLMVTLEIVKVI